MWRSEKKKKKSTTQKLLPHHCSVLTSHSSVRLFKHAITSFCLLYYSWIKLNCMSDVQSRGGRATTHVRLPARDIRESGGCGADCAANASDQYATWHRDTPHHYWGLLTASWAACLKAKRRESWYRYWHPLGNPHPGGWVSRQQQQKKKVDRFFFSFFLPSHASQCCCHMSISAPHPQRA